MKVSRGRLVLLCGLVMLGTALALMAVLWPNWIETALLADPDGGDGLFEWGAAAALGALVMVCVSAPPESDVGQIPPETWD